MLAYLADRLIICTFQEISLPAIKSPTTDQCSHTASPRLRNRRHRDINERQRLEIHINWIQRRIFFIGLAKFYFLSTFEKWKPCLSFLEIISNTSRNVTRLFTQSTSCPEENIRRFKKRIDSEHPALRTPQQNGLAERSGGVMVDGTSICKVKCSDETLSVENTWIVINIRLSNICNDQRRMYQ